MGLFPFPPDENLPAADHLVDSLPVEPPPAENLQAENLLVADIYLLSVYSSLFTSLLSLYSTNSILMQITHLIFLIPKFNKKK
jgi:hypothetical protein